MGAASLNDSLRSATGKLWQTGLVSSAGLGEMRRGGVYTGLKSVGPWLAGAPGPLPTGFHRVQLIA